MRHNEPSHLDFDAVILKLGIHTSMLEDMLAKLPQEMSMVQIQFLEGKVSAIVQEIAQYKDSPTLGIAYVELIRMSDKLLQAYKEKQLEFQKAHMDQPALETQKERKDFKEDKYTSSLDSFCKLMKTIMHKPVFPLNFDNTMGKIVQYRNIFKHMPQYLPEIHTLQEFKLFKETALAMADEISRIYNACSISDIPEHKERERLDKAYGELKGLHDEALKTYNEKLWEPLKSHYDKYALELQKKLRDFKESKEVFTLTDLETKIQKLDKAVDQHLSATPTHYQQISSRELAELQKEMRQSHQALKSAYQERSDQIDFDAVILKLGMHTSMLKDMLAKLPQEMSMVQIQFLEGKVSAIVQEIAQYKDSPTLGIAYVELIRMSDKLLQAYKEKQLEFQKAHMDQPALEIQKEQKDFKEDKYTSSLDSFCKLMKTIMHKPVFPLNFDNTMGKIVQYRNIFKHMPQYLPEIHTLQEFKLFKETALAMADEISRIYNACSISDIPEHKERERLDKAYGELKGLRDEALKACNEKLKTHTDKSAEDEASKRLKESHQKRHEEIEKSAASFSSSQEKVRLKAPGSSALFSGSNSSTSSSSSSSFSNR